MVPTIRSVLDDELQHLSIDLALLKRVRDYRIAFVNRNPEHVAFFGGNLTGVQRVRFVTKDRVEWYTEVIGIDDLSATNRIKSLPSLNPEWKRGTDIFNLSCLWLVYKIYNSHTLTEADKRMGMIEVLMMLQYKLLTSLIAYYFPHQVPEAKAMAVYAALNRKYDLKQYGSWNALILARSQAIIAANSIHIHTVKRFEPDSEVQYMITDVQNRLKGMIKSQWDVLDRVNASDAKIYAVKGVINLDGEQIVRDMTRIHTPYVNYIHQVINDKSRFIRNELIDVVGTAMHKMPVDGLRKTLEYAVDNYGLDETIVELVDLTMQHMIRFIMSEKGRSLTHNHLGDFIISLRAVYMSSRSTDDQLMKMRNLAENLVVKAVKTKNAALAASIRTGFLLYVVLRTLSMHHYE